MAHNWTKKLRKVGCSSLFDCSRTVSVRYQTKSYIGESDKECLIYKEKSNLISTRPFGKETKSYLSTY